MNWKIISIILLSLLIATNGYWFYLLDEGMNMVEYEYKCGEACSTIDNMTAYYVSDYTGACFCTDINGKSYPIGVE